MEIILAALAGLAVGCVGSLAGIGGGFLVMPLLLELRPGDSAAVLSATVMLVILANSLAGAGPAALRGGFDRRLALRLALVVVPCALIGTVAQELLAPGVFRRAFGWFMAAAALFLAVIQHPALVARAERRRASSGGNSAPGAVSGGVTAGGIGIISGFFGVGGGFMIVPLLRYGRGMAVRQATLVSQAVLAVLAAAVLALAAARGRLSGVEPLVWPLIAGVIPGARLGALLSRRLHGAVVLGVLALMLLVAGVRLALA